MAKAKVKPGSESAAWAALGADPEMVRVKALIEAEEEKYLRWYSRLKRALTGMENARCAIKNMRKWLDKRAAEQQKPKETT